nr:hypothetical protein [Tanacetum cinerariifolium]
MSDVSPYLAASDDDIPTVVSLSLMGTCQVSICLGKATSRHRSLQPRFAAMAGVSAFLQPPDLTDEDKLLYLYLSEAWFTDHRILARKPTPFYVILIVGYWCPALACYCNFEIPFDIYAF